MAARCARVAAMLARGIAMLTEDRIGDGLVLGLSIRDNVSLAASPP